MSSQTLMIINPTTTTTTTSPKPLTPIRSKTLTPTTSTIPNTTSFATTHRRDFLTLSSITTLFLTPLSPAWAASDDEYVKETTEVIDKVRNTMKLDKTDPNIANAVAELRETSNYWVAKYRREKALLGRVSFRDMYSALNAVSGHYVSFGPTAPIPAKRKQRILEEMDTVEKALQRGR